MLCLRAQREYGLFLAKTILPRHFWLRSVGVSGISALWFSRAANCTNHPLCLPTREQRQMQDSFEGRNLTCLAVLYGSPRRK